MLAGFLLQIAFELLSWACEFSGAWWQGAVLAGVSRLGCWTVLVGGSRSVLCLAAATSGICMLSALLCLNRSICE